MYTKKIFYALIVLLLPSLLCLSCHSSINEENSNVAADTEKNDSLSNEEILAHVQQYLDEGNFQEASIWLDKLVHEDDDEYEEDEEIDDNESLEESATTQTKRSTAKAPARRETLYISTFAANGRVWGHVTMNGNTGRGTIHDEEDNHFTITVTRHGNELFGIDQNGREYVFRL